MKNLKKLWENKMMRMFIIVIIAIIFIIILVGLLLGGNKEINDKNLTSAAQKYYAANPLLLPQNEYDMTTVNLSTLISLEYLNSDAEGANCPSYVTVIKMNGKYEYVPFINCSNGGTASNTLMSKIMSSLVTSGDGLYSYNGKYIYRGENPNNYVSFGEKLWRIIGIDSNNNIRLIHVDDEKNNVWDNRYNSDIDKQWGINDYEKSRLKIYLDSYFANNPKIFTASRLARMTKHSACIGKIDMSSSSVDSCSDTIDLQWVSIITVNDYMDASLDSLCTTTNTKPCQNYNFLNLDGWTGNASSKDSVNVYYIDDRKGILEESARIRNVVRPIITLKNDVIYASGTGTQTDPYTIR